MRFGERNYPLYIGVVLSTAFVMLALIGPAIAPQHPLEVAPAFLFNAFRPGELPGYPLGTDEVGRDVLSRMLWGIRPTLLLALAIMAARLAVGTLLGLVAGWYRGIAERAIDMAIGASVAVPTLVFAIAVIFLIGVQRGIWVFIVALSITGWADTAALIKSRTLTIRQAPYIESAYALGVRPTRVLLRHILPQLWPLLPVLMAFELGAAILLVAELGFLGIFIGGGFIYRMPRSDSAGEYSILTSGMPELGQMLSGFWSKVWRAPWEPLFVGIVVFVMVAAFNMLGEGLRRRVDVTRVRLSWTWLRSQREDRERAPAGGLGYRLRRYGLLAASGLTLAALLFALTRPTPVEHPTAAGAPGRTPVPSSGQVHPTPSAPQQTPSSSSDEAGSLPSVLPASLYLVSGERDRRPLPIDPLSLEWLPENTNGDEHVRLSWIGSSADGSTLVVIVVRSHSGIQTVVSVIDGSSGELRTQFTAQVGPLFLYDHPETRVSADGSVLFINGGSRGLGTNEQQYVFSLADGRLISSFRTAIFQSRWLDPGGKRLYGLHMPDPGNGVGLRAPLLMVFDTTTGKKVGEVALDWTGAGRGKVPFVEGGEPVQVNREPGIALRPDGRYLAVLHADREAVSLIDAETLQVERTIELQGASGAAADAARRSYILSELAFSPDGKHLFAAGEVKMLNEDGSSSYQGLGLRKIDVESGQIVAELLQGERIERLFVVPDGSAIYVVGPGEVDGQRSRNVLRRIDPVSLEVTAARPLTAFVQLLPVVRPEQ
ncbi:MAG: hypothetical protein KatS3mg057_0377 [Herpetosiphonaceae bacterium]|nr:MAG: hypothetical protein KatS3mg057_0377 [Herpetosiphonaceae bacterium]